MNLTRGCRCLYYLGEDLRKGIVLPDRKPFPELAREAGLCLSVHVHKKIGACPPDHTLKKHLVYDCLYMESENTWKVDLDIPEEYRRGSLQDGREDLSHI